MDPVSIYYYIALALIVTSLLILVMLIISCYIRFIRIAATAAATTSNNQFLEVPLPPATIINIGVGLDMPIIESYPKLVLGESRRLYGPNSDPCSICLCEYNAKDTIRYIPWCNHCFHADCIDQWLQMSDRCPICRTSPAPSTSSADNMPIMPPFAELLPAYN